MIYQNLALLAGFLLLYSIFAGRFARRLVNGPLFFMLAGWLMGPSVTGWLQLGIRGEGIRLLAELTLAIVLFTDAANANLAVLRANNWLPLRLLLVGLPLTLLAGSLAAHWLFPGMPWLEVAILSTILAPTDAALGKAVVVNPAVPAPLREGLNVESGLNDGICVPVLLILLALLLPEEQHQGTASLALALIAEEIGLGAAVGVVLALLTTVLMRLAARHHWQLEPWQMLIMPALALLDFSLAQWLGGSGFIAAFVGGLVAGRCLGAYRNHYLEGNESYGELLSVLVWVVFGAVVLHEAWPYMSWQIVLYAVTSLTVLRMVPVWLSLVGTGLPAGHRLFVGWFGPRGLASIVFGVMVMQYSLQTISTIIATVICTIVLSVVLHGLTANPWANRIGNSEARP